MVQTRYSQQEMRVYYGGLDGDGEVMSTNVSGRIQLDMNRINIDSRIDCVLEVESIAPAVVIPRTVFIVSFGQILHRSRRRAEICLCDTDVEFPIPVSGLVQTQLPQGVQLQWRYKVPGKRTRDEFRFINSQGTFQLDPSRVIPGERLVADALEQDSDDEK